MSTKKPLKLRPDLPKIQDDLESRLERASDWAEEAMVPKVAQAVAVYPWSNAHPKVIKNFVLRLPEKTHLKLLFLAQNEPNSSMHKLIMEAVEEHVENLLAKYTNRRNDEGS